MTAETIVAPAAAPLLFSMTGTVAPNGTTIFTADLVAGQTYVVSLRGAGASPLLDPGLTIGDGTPKPLAIDDDGGVGTDALITFTPTVSGTYQFGASGANGTAGDVVLDIAAMGADTVGNTAATAATLTPGTTFDFLETSSDVDFYRVELTEGMVYTFAIGAGADGTGGPLQPGEIDTELVLLDANGAIVARNDDVAGDDLSSALGFQATATGTYSLATGGATAHAGGGYALRMTEQALTGLDPVDTLNWGTKLASNNVTVYFAGAGEVVGGMASEGWSSYEIGRAMTALAEWSAVTNLTFSITTDASAATFRLVTGDLDGGTLGAFMPPGEANAGVGYFANDGRGWDVLGGLERGGYGFLTLVHEFGHGLGLAHPHDNGGGSPVMPGVVGPTGTFGPYGLNSTVYTVMSYNDGWPAHPDAAGGMPPATATSYGLPMGPSALDIAAIQALYGTVDRAAGNTVYLLSDVNALGTGYRTIWDTGGSDTIRYDGNRDTVIDLTAATLDYTPTGGGVVSYARDIFGGFTIANGVVIENAIGGGGRDGLVGNAAANLLDGRGGADVMAARGGNDRYIVDNGGDQVIEAAGEGIDTVEASVHYALTANVERLILRGSANLAGIGNALDNSIAGNAGNNRIDGGAGADSLYGGAGNDRYVVDNAGDRVFENAGEGLDQVEASVSFSLAGQHIENLILTGTADIDCTGSGLANGLKGNAGSNILDGGAGADRMAGGEGSDVYIVDDTGDVVIEFANEGYDAVLSSVSFALTGQYVEELRLIGGDAIDGRGNGLANNIWGNGAANLLRGEQGDDQLHGGLGADMLVGGAGADQFWFDTALGNGNVDHIVDFSVADDTIVLDRTIFTGLAASETLADAAFRIGTAALDADDRILYDAATGNLWYDADGAGGRGAILFATLSTGLALDADDFFVVTNL